jgi:hypothetical protein
MAREAVAIAASTSTFSNPNIMSPAWPTKSNPKSPNLN